MIAGVLFLIFNVAAIHYTSENWFCGNACHVMGTYYESWKTDVHEDEGVKCVSCHIPPGTQNYVMAKLNGLGQLIDDLLGRTSGKPSASVSDFACTRSGCHDLAEV
ncbi:MAG: NapC/NirT family cytochrome c, partial [Planctomycetota bacterium]